MFHELLNGFKMRREGREIWGIGNGQNIKSRQSAVANLEANKLFLT
jgi:hypothetical protein